MAACPLLDVGAADEPPPAHPLRRKEAGVDERAHTSVADAERVRGFGN